VQYALRLLFLVALAIATGCNRRPAAVGLQGIITFDGRPIERGKIDFVPVDNTPGASVLATIDDGKYDVPTHWGPLCDGVYLVRIVAYRKTGKTEPNRIMPGGPHLEILENSVPARYNEQSTLKVRIADLPDKNKVDFALGKTAATAVPH
jgi:hypothetical protein